MFQRGARKAGAHAVGGQKSAQALAHGDVLSLEFGELIAVQPVGELGDGGGQRQHGDLHHRIIAGEPAHQAQRLGVDQVFGVVGHDDLVADAMEGFVPFHAVIGPVQAIALGGGAVVRADDEVYAGVEARRFFHSARRGVVIGVNADEDIVCRIADGGEIMFQHVPDDAVFAPQRHQYGDTPLGALIEIRIGRPRETACG